MLSDSQCEMHLDMVPEMSVADALRIATAFEQRAQQFYLELAERVHPEARPLALQLADEELRHYELLRNITVAGDFEHAFEKRLPMPLTQKRFDDFVALPALPDFAAEDAILDYAESRERIAFEHYSHLAQSTPPGALRDLFAFLRDEEQRHEAQMQSRWAAMFSVF